MPWSIKRRSLCHFLGYQIDPTAKIGLSWVYPDMLTMDGGASMGSFNVCKGISLLEMGVCSRIGLGNWITGHPLGCKNHFSHQQDRQPILILGEHATITRRHLIDCTSKVCVNRFATLAGYGTQIITHSIDIKLCRQSSESVEIGEFCFVGTDCTILGGSVLPKNSVLGAKSLLNKHYVEGWSLYAGVPARKVRDVPRDHKYFLRELGAVD